jgi:hypothetical protein
MKFVWIAFFALTLGGCFGPQYATTEFVVSKLDKKFARMLSAETCSQRGIAWLAFML